MTARKTIAILGIALLLAAAFVPHVAVVVCVAVAILVLSAVVAGPRRTESAPSIASIARFALVPFRAPPSLV